MDTFLIVLLVVIAAVVVIQRLRNRITTLEGSVETLQNELAGIIRESADLRQRMEDPAEVARTIG